MARQKVMKPRTYRPATGSNLFIGGLTRTDINHISTGSSVHVTVWV
jgi:hypothetical protein